MEVKNNVRVSKTDLEMAQIYRPHQLDPLMLSVLVLSESTSSGSVCNFDGMLAGEEVAQSSAPTNYHMRYMNHSKHSCKL